MQLAQPCQTESVRCAFAAALQVKVCGGQCADVDACPKQLVRQSCEGICVPVHKADSMSAQNGTFEPRRDRHVADRFKPVIAAQAFVDVKVQSKPVARRSAR